MPPRILANVRISSPDGMTNPHTNLTLTTNRRRILEIQITGLLLVVSSLQHWWPSCNHLPAIPSAIADLGYSGLGYRGLQRDFEEMKEMSATIWLGFKPRRCHWQATGRSRCPPLFCNLC